jgi:hypothetical protein
MLGVTSREWVAAFYLIVGVALIAALGLQPVTALVILSITVITWVASRACRTEKYSYWTGMMLVASINPTGETLIGQIFVLPALALATVYSWLLGLTWILGGREWPRNRWFAFLRRYQRAVIRVRPKS